MFPKGAGYDLSCHHRWFEGGLTGFDSWLSGASTSGDSGTLVPIRLVQGLAAAATDPCPSIKVPSFVRRRLVMKSRRASGTGIQMQYSQVLCPPDAWIGNRRRARSAAPCPDCL